MTAPHPVWTAPPPMPPGKRLALALVAAVPVTVAAVVAEVLAVWEAVPACEAAPVPARALALCLLVVAGAFLVPGAIAGLRTQAHRAVLAGAAGAAIPALVLLHVAATPQHGFCIPF